MLSFNILKSKTFWGAIGVAISYLASQEAISLVAIAQAVSGVLMAIGLRDAQSK